MKPRLIWVAAIILVAAIGGVVWFAVDKSRVCPAIGSATPIELKIVSAPSRVQACFGENCTPRPLQQQTDGRWLVPQEPPYLAAEQTTSPPSVLAKVRVVVKESGKRQRDAVFDIPAIPGVPNTTGAECPGPIQYLPVEVP
ncbi:hypothetical protein [Arthrobacter sp. StoSoilB5]|uniref:hypothetical protein n=1 Tax=Arthrobacter sp. StoSoilB5 TaxID=2830992 RepID=UPI001CC520AB|nr:hypothetical protein [Arthrobacter sp. StoSoilB5]BCW47611.1 hypothetical protein StoSoilB5_47950 [Arthrobacter sp. StoSoilB5]